MTDGFSHDIRMSLGDHLQELRCRLIYSLVGIVLAAAAALAVGKRLMQLLALPLADALVGAGQDPKIHAFAPQEAFLIYLKMGLTVGLIVASPWVLIQGWKFVSVGLYASEKRVARMLVPFSATMALLGVLFMYYIMLPMCLWFFISFSTNFPPVGTGDPSWFYGLMQSEPETESPGAKSQESNQLSADDPPADISVLSMDPTNPNDGQFWFNSSQGQLVIQWQGQPYRVRLNTASESLIRPLIGAAQYINFVLLLTIGIVVAFQLPVVMVTLGWTGLVSPQLFRKYRAHCVFACFALGMLLTPADPLSMIALALPLWGLFELGLVLMRMVWSSR